MYVCTYIGTTGTDVVVHIYVVSQVEHSGRETYSAAMTHIHTSAGAISGGSSQEMVFIVYNSRPGWRMQQPYGHVTVRQCYMIYTCERNRYAGLLWCIILVYICACMPHRIDQRNVFSVQVSQHGE